MRKFTENQIRRAYEELMKEDTDDFIIALLIVLNGIYEEDLSNKTRRL